MSCELEYIKGGIAIDDRGELQFCNDFDMTDVKRFYVVSNHKKKFIRAWHGHKNECKCVTVLTGSAIVAAVKIDDWKNPSKDAEVHRYVLSSKNPGILKIPAGYANGFMTLTNDAKLVFFSTSTLKESMKDDYRFDANYWNPWNVEER